MIRDAIFKDTPKLATQKEIYRKIVYVAEANTTAELEGDLLRGIISSIALHWHNLDGVFNDLTREEAFSAMYIGQDRAHQTKGIHGYHKEKLARTLASKK